MRFSYKYEVKKMRELKDWPFEPLGGGVNPCDGIGNGSGGGPPQ